MQVPFFAPISSAQEWPNNRGHLLSAGEIQIWKASLNVDGGTLAGSYALLSGDEKMRADRLRIDAARRRFIGAHAILRRILGIILGQPPAEVILSAAPGGKPFLPEAPLMSSKPIRFNLAHSLDWMLVSVSRDFETGIDLEFVDPEVEFEQISTHFFSAPDLAWLESRPADQKLAAFFRMWTCKEAVLKAEGSGIRLGLAEVQIDFKGDDSAKGVSAGDRHAGRGWTICVFEPAARYIAALATESNASAAESPKLTYFQWMG